MTFKSKDIPRKLLERLGLSAAPLVIALHTLPRHEDALMPPPEHVPDLTYHPEQAISSDVISIPLGGAGDGPMPFSNYDVANDVARRWHEHAREQRMRAVYAANSMMMNNNPALFFEANRAAADNQNG